MSDLRCTIIAASGVTRIDGLPERPAIGTGDRCYSCDRLLKSAWWADTRDDQIVVVGAECHRRIVAAGEAGYQPRLGGPRLYALPRAGKGKA